MSRRCIHEGAAPLSIGVDPQPSSTIEAPDGVLWIVGEEIAAEGDPPEHAVVIKMAVQTKRSWRT
jgi:hypothetical protein